MTLSISHSFAPNRPRRSRDFLRVVSTTTFSYRPDNCPREIVLQRGYFVDAMRVKRANVTHQF